VDLHNTFEVSLPPEDAWKVLLDIPRIAPCMPGAELTEVVDPKTYKGKVSVRLGPVQLSFQGIAAFEEVDDASHSARVKAQGTDTKGRGGANAVVNFKLEPSATGSKVDVNTTLNLSGSVAQYGRGAGMIQAVAAQLIGQFAKNLEAELQRSGATATGDAASQAAAAGGEASAPAPRPAGPSPAVPAKPISGFSLLWAAFADWVKGLFGGKKTG